MYMTPPDFYVISDKFTRGALNLIPILNADFYKVFRGEFMPEKVVEFIPNCGSRTYDFLNAGYAGLHLVSKKIIQLFRTNDLNGWLEKPVRIKGYEDFEYYLFMVTGRCSAINFEKSQTFIKAPFAPTGKPVEVKRGLYFDIRSWDGSDVFTPENSMFTFVTEKAAKLLSDNKVTNLIICNTTHFELL
jgi:hypothetical protein